MESKKTRKLKMDFKSLIQKIDSLDDKVEAPKAPESKQAIKLDEGAELKVLAGTRTLKESVEAVVEAEKKETTWTDKSGKKHPATQVKGDKYTGKEAEKEEKAKSKKVDEATDMKTGDKKKSSTGGTIEKTKTGLKHTAGQNYSGKTAEKEEKSKKKTDESVEYEAFKSKFMQMVEAKKAEEAKMKTGDKKKSSTGGTIEKTKTGLKHTAGKNYSGKEAEKESKKKVDEAAKPDFLDMDKDGNKKEPMKKAVADKKKGAVKKAEESKMMPKGKKRPMKESVERQLSFREMMKLVVESGGQQQIDPLDEELFAWASRVAKNKLGEGMKAEVYAGMVYERMGGRFEMYDVLSENKK